MFGNGFGKLVNITFIIMEFGTLPLIAIAVEAPVLFTLYIAVLKKGYLTIPLDINMTA